MIREITEEEARGDFASLMAEVEAGDWFDMENVRHAAWLHRCISRRVGSGGKFYALWSARGDPLGLYCLLLEDRPDRKGYAEILDLGVVAERRRQGHGTRLLQDAERKCRAAGVSCVHVSTYAGDANAIAFYQRSGFIPVAEVPGLNGPDDRGQVVMQKELSQQVLAGDAEDGAACAERRPDETIRLTLHDATDRDLRIARNLVPYYIYDMSEHLGWPCTAEGRFDGCDELPSYWEEPGKHAFLLRAGEEIAGFALVRGDHDEDDLDYSIGEFFILRRFRGQGAGEAVARELFDRFPGRWEVRQLARNTPAVAFWRKVIGRYPCARFHEREGESPWGEMNVIRFGNDGSSQPATPADGEDAAAE